MTCFRGTSSTQAEDYLLQEIEGRFDESDKILNEQQRSLDEIKPKRYLLHAKIKDGKLKEYIQRHNNIYPEVSDGLKEAGAKQLTIWVKDRLAENPEIVMYVTMRAGTDM